MLTQLLIFSDNSLVIPVTQIKPIFPVRNPYGSVHTDKALGLNTISVMTENEIMTRDIHNFVRGKLNAEESASLLTKVSKSEEWTDNLLFEIWLYETITSMKRKGISLNK